MSRPDPIQYADRLYAAIRAANFSPISFLAFGNAVKEGVELRRMPRIAAEPFMRVVGEMLDLEEAADEGIIDADVHPVDGREGEQPFAAQRASAVERLDTAMTIAPETSKDTSER
jgi:hypothetical protein